VTAEGVPNTVRAAFFGEKIFYSRSLKNYLSGDTVWGEGVNVLDLNSFKSPIVS
jgi:hypothetical protein